MENIGMIRRIDDLGRVVIPRDIRRTLHIREGDPLEIFLDNGEVKIKKILSHWRTWGFCQGICRFAARDHRQYLYDS